VSVTIKGSGLSGATVVKAAQALPQNATATLFTVSGGAVLIHAIAGLVTTALGATVTSLALGNTPTGGANSSASIATSAVVTSKALGTWYVPSFASGIAGAPIQANAVNFDRSFAILVPAGAITWTTTASDTGGMAWYLNYTPLDSGASVG
jgi:hypothetical protein